MTNEEIRADVQESKPKFKLPKFVTDFVKLALMAESGRWRLFLDADTLGFGLKQIAVKSVIYAHTMAGRSTKHRRKRKIKCETLHCFADGFALKGMMIVITLED